MPSSRIFRSTCVVLIFIFLSASTRAATIWQDGGFKIETAKKVWVNEDVFPLWTGIKLGFIVPPNGYVVFEEPGSIELFFPCLGWVEDIGITVGYGCLPPTAGYSRDTRIGAVVFNADEGCKEKGGRIFVLVCVPKFFTSKECHPTAIRWMTGKGYYDVQED